jgi:hypothetical protein
MPRVTKVHVGPTRRTWAAFSTLPVAGHDCPEHTATSGAKECCDQAEDGQQTFHQC